MCPASEPSICMSHLLSTVEGLFELGMLDPTSVIGDAGVLRRLDAQILRSEFKFGNNNSGRPACTLVRGSTNILNQLFLKDFWLEIAVEYTHERLYSYPQAIESLAIHLYTSE